MEVARKAFSVTSAVSDSGYSRAIQIMFEDIMEEDANLKRPGYSAPAHNQRCSKLD